MGKERNMKKIKKWWNNSGKFSKFILVLAFITAVGVIGNAIEGENTTADGENNLLNANNEEGKENSQIEEFYIGDKVIIDNVEYTVNSIEMTKEIGTQYIKSTAKDTYMIINITITNNKNDLLSINNSYFRLQLGEKTYRSSNTTLLENNIIIKGINPDVTLTGNIIFDITEATATNPSLQLQIQTDYLGREKETINLYKN
jgi:Telomeric repeat-binding factor 2.